MFRCRSNHISHISIWHGYFAPSDWLLSGREPTYCPRNLQTIVNDLRRGWCSGKISASQSWGPQFDSRPDRGLNIWVTFFPAKVHSAFHPFGSVKCVPAYMDRFEAAARGAYICFRSAGGKLIIVKRLWACYMEKALYKCTTLLYFLHTPAHNRLHSIVLIIRKNVI